MLAVLWIKDFIEHLQYLKATKTKQALTWTREPFRSGDSFTFPTVRRVSRVGTVKRLNSCRSQGGEQMCGPMEGTSGFLES